jgi:ribose transport system permease protein
VAKDQAAAIPAQTEAIPVWRTRLAGSFTLLILIVIMAIFTIWEGTKFFNLVNFNTIAIDSSQLLLLAVGSTFVIITAGIDLSVSSTLVLSAVIAAQLMVQLSGTPAQVAAYEFPNQNVAIPIGLAAGVLTGLVCGIINGLLVTRLKMPPFIVTLGTLGVYLGVAQLLTGGTTVPNVPPAVQTDIGLRTVIGFTIAGQQIRLTPPLLIALGIAFVCAIALNRTRFGRYTYAIGSNVAAARRVGIDVERHLIKVYALCGLLAGVAGSFDLLRFGTASVGSHTDDNLAAISAAVIGGTSLFGGIGTIGGTVVGALIPAVLRNGLVIGRVPSFWQNVAIGMVLIVAVYLDQRRRASEERM